MKVHKLAKLFPEITGDDFKALVLDIKTSGLRQPITTLDGQILDGSNRYRACIAADVEPRLEEYVGDNPLAFVKSQNLNRRHLSESQRAMVAAEIAKCQNSDTSVTAEAAEFKVSRESVHKAVKIKRESPALARKVRDGKISLNAAHEKLHPSNKPLPKGGLCADDLRAQRGEPETPPNSVLPPEPVKPSKPAPQQAATLTVARCQELVDEIERMIPKDGDHDKFGDVLYRAAERQMNWKKAGKAHNPYAGKR